MIARAALLAAAASLVGCSPVAAGRTTADQARAVPVRATVGAASVQMPAPTPTADARGCGDLLARLGRKPEQARYVGCKFFPDEQAAPVRATYEVAGRDAAAVEAQLIRSSALDPLKRACCQWDSSPIGFVDGAGRQFTLTMASVETKVTRRDAWAEIPTFRVTVEMLTEEI